jgi:hypothetical protein
MSRFSRAMVQFRLLPATICSIRATSAYAVRSSRRKIHLGSRVRVQAITSCPCRRALVDDQATVRPVAAITRPS